MLKQDLISQLNIIIQEIDKLLKLEGSITDFSELAPHMVPKMIELRNWAHVCKIRIEETK